MSKVDFSAEFGGRDAAAAVLPHFKALKAASRGLCLEGFPFAKLAFILRVDGEVHCYEISGAGNLEVDKDEGYLSVDIGINHSDRERASDVISAAIVSSIEKIKATGENNPWNVDLQALRRCLIDLIARYEDELNLNP